MRHQGIWAGWMLVLAPIMAFAEDGIALPSADEGGPISALNAYAQVTGEVEVEILADDVIVTGNPDPEAGARLENLVLELQLASPDSKYWLGLDCEPLGDTLRSQLGLAEQTGLVIVAVADNSPAKAAGLQNNDVVALAQLGDKQHSISNVEQFAELIQQAETKPIKLTVVRGGKAVVVPVTPAERPGVVAAQLGRLGGADAGKGRGGFVFKLGEPPAKKAEQKQERRQRRGARRHGEGHRDRHARADRGDDHPRKARRGDAVRGRGRHHAGRGHRGWSSRRGDEVGGFRGRHPRHMGQRGPQRQFGRMAMMGQGRFGGFAHRGPWQGRLFGRHFAQQDHGRPFNRSFDSRRSSIGMEDRLEALVSRLEKLAGPEGLGRFDAVGALGRFQSPFANQREERGGRPEFGRPGPQRGGQRAEPSRREESAEPNPLDHMRRQLQQLQEQQRQLQEQQESMMKAIRNLSEALEKSSRK